jgi:CO/xanthine dehydrogenase Mo-binding subunit
LGGRLLTLCLEALRDKKSKGAPFPLKAEKTYRRPPHLAWNSENFTGIPYITFSWGAAVAEVEWDRVFSRIKISRLTLTLACGQPEDPVLARISVAAAVRAALGWCLVEQAETLPWPAQRLLRQEEMPEVEVNFLPSGPKTPSRGVDNIPWAVVPPAVLSAISQATGAPIDRWPLTRKDLPEGIP